MQEEYGHPRIHPPEEALATKKSPSPAVHRASTAVDKIALFRSLFRGREDVYSKRFESQRTGRSG